MCSPYNNMCSPYNNMCSCDRRYVRLLCTVASVLCFTQTMALATICVLCFILFATVLYCPPFQVAAINYCVLGTTGAALLTNVVLFRAAWALKDIDHVNSVRYVEQRPFKTFAHPETLDAWAGGVGLALPREQLCLTVSEDHDEIVSEVSLPTCPPARPPACVRERG